jgi:predicted CXXCH cytochrome family protein
MNRYLCSLPVLAAVFLFAAELPAAQPTAQPTAGPSVIKLKMGGKTFNFTHHKHQLIPGSKCWECHDKKNGKIENWGEATAHKLCIPCHDLNEKGPISCKGCHKK